jgi:hypothetical protein
MLLGRDGVVGAKMIWSVVGMLHEVFSKKQVSATNARCFIS